MKTSIHGISLEYGDALLKLLKIKIISSKREEYDVTHNHKFYELHLAHQGSYTYTVGDEQITLQKNQLLIIPPNIPHVSVSGKKGDYEYSCLSIHLSQIVGVAGFFSYFENVLNKYAKTPITVQPSLIGKISKLHDLDQQSNIIRDTCALKVYASSFFYELFYLLDGFSSTTPQHSSQIDTDERLVLLEELMNDQNLSLSEISKEIGYSSRHTARLINKYYGCSLSEFRKRQAVIHKKKEV